MKISDLTKQDLTVIVVHRPDWVADNYPHWMAQYHTDWMGDNRIGWMVEHRPEWMAINRPESLIKFNKMSAEVPEDIMQLINPK